MIASLASPHDVLDFWRHAGEQRWWAKDDAFDAVVRARFQATWQAARDGKLRSWQETDDGALALVIVLDQFPRNMFRNTPTMFSTDATALDAARLAIMEGRDTRADEILRPFYFLPFMHSETLADQEECIELYKRSDDMDNLKYAEEHADIIRKFGRFPHRNKTLGRKTTPEEDKFLKDGGFAG